MRLEEVFDGGRALVPVTADRLRDFTSPAPRHHEDVAVTTLLEHCCGHLHPPGGKVRVLPDVPTVLGYHRSGNTVGL